MHQPSTDSNDELASCSWICQLQQEVSVNDVPVAVTPAMPTGNDSETLAHRFSMADLQATLAG